MPQTRSPTRTFCIATSEHYYFSEYKQQPDGSRLAGNTRHGGTHRSWQKRALLCGQHAFLAASAFAGLLPPTVKLRRDKTARQAGGRESEVSPERIRGRPMAAGQGSEV